jgi:hypothetical protein
MFKNKNNFKFGAIKKVKQIFPQSSFVAVVGSGIRYPGG